MSNKKFSVLIVDDHELLRRGVRALLEASKNTSFCAEAESVTTAIDVYKKMQPDVVLMDVRLADGTGFECCRELKKISDNEARVLFLSGYPEEHLIMEAVHSGADGYLLKAVKSSDLISSIIKIAEGESVWDPVVTKFLIKKEKIRSDDQSSLLDSLSKQEIKIAAYIAEGMTNKEIATAMGLAEKTVRNYLANAMGKLNVSRRAQLAAFYATLENNKN